MSPLCRCLQSGTETPWALSSLRSALTRTRLVVLRVRQDSNGFGRGHRLRIAKHDGKRFHKGLRFAKPRCFSRPFPRGSHNHRCRNIARPRVRRHQERQTRPHPAVQTKRCAPVPCGPSDDALRRSAQKVRIRATVSKQGLPDFCSMPRQSRKIIGRVRAASAGDGAPRFAG